MKFAVGLLFGALFASSSVMAAQMAGTPDFDHSVAVDAAPAAEALAGWQQVFEETFQVPSGYAYSPVYDFGASGYAVDALKVEMFTPPGRICGASLYSVDVATAPAQALLSRYYANAAGEIALPNTPIFKLVVVLNQPRLLGGACVVRLSALPHGATDGGPDDNTDTFQLAGVAHYTGGFANRLSVPVSPNNKIVRFWVRIPQFCQGLEVLEAGSVTEGVYDVARQFDAAQHIFEVNGGAGSRATSLDVTLNGPAALTCDVPVYVQTAL